MSHERAISMCYNPGQPTVHRDSWAMRTTRMIPYFNTSGPCIRGQHHMLSPRRRLVRTMELVEQGRYFTLHAGRQTGKTTSARWLVDHYRAAGNHAALWIDIQAAREEPDPSRAFRTIFSALDQWVELDLPDLELAPDRHRWLDDPRTAVRRYLADLAGRLARPLVLLFDEADGLVGEAMVSFLTQLRQGYIARDRSPFPHSVALIGMREVRDYVMAAEDRHAESWLGTTSPFNITAEGQTLAPFSADEVAELLQQHTAATGQRFGDRAAARVHELSCGHPWLVNAMADQMVRDVEDRSVSLTARHVESAKETIILQRRTHIDSLLARLREERVRRVLAPMLAGERTGADVLDDDFTYVVDLGLLALRDGRWQVANPIYREVIPRALVHAQQAQISHEPAWYLDDAGDLQVGKLLRAFQAFWREDGHLAAEGFHYREAGPHLMLMAFLQRVVNSGGRVQREYGLGRGRLDLVVHWQDRRHAVEVKLRRDTRTEALAVTQLAGYLDQLGLDEGWVVLFDLREGVDWEQKLYEKKLEEAGRKIIVLGC